MRTSTLYRNRLGIRITPEYPKRYIPQSILLDGYWGKMEMKLKPIKYPDLIEYYRRKGYRVDSDFDLRDVHAWIPLQLYVQFIAKASGKFSRERGKISKAIAEAIEKWLREEPYAPE
jgi:hypothetical protein